MTERTIPPPIAALETQLPSEIAVEAEKDALEALTDVNRPYTHELLALLPQSPMNAVCVWNVNDVTRRMLCSHDVELRVFDVTDTPFLVQCIPILIDANRWLIDQLEPDRRYAVQLGYTLDGEFSSYIASGATALPPDRVSRVVDSQYATVRNPREVGGDLRDRIKSRRYVATDDATHSERSYAESTANAPVQRDEATDEAADEWPTPPGFQSWGSSANTPKHENS